MELMKLGLIFLVTFLKRSSSTTVTFFGSNGTAKSYDLKGGCNHSGGYYGRGVVDFYGGADVKQSTGQWSVVADIPDCPNSFKWKWQATGGRYEAISRDGGYRELDKTLLNGSHAVVYSQLGRLGQPTRDEQYGIHRLSVVAFVLEFDVDNLNSTVCGSCVNLVNDYGIASNWFCLPPGDIVNSRSVVVSYLPTGCEFVYQWKLWNRTISSKVNGWLKNVASCDGREEGRLLLVRHADHKGECIDRSQFFLTTTATEPFATSNESIAETNLPPSGDVKLYLIVGGAFGGGLVLILAVMTACLCRKHTAKVKLNGLEMRRTQSRKNSNKGAGGDVDPSLQYAGSYSYVDSKETCHRLFRKQNVARSEVPSAEYEGVDPSGYVDRNFSKPCQLSFYSGNESKLRDEQTKHSASNYINELPTVKGNLKKSCVPLQDSEGGDYVDIEDTAPYCQLDLKKARQEHMYQSTSAVMSNVHHSPSSCQQDQEANDRDYIEVEDAVTYSVLKPVGASDEHIYECITK